MMTKVIIVHKDGKEPRRFEDKHGDGDTDCIHYQAQLDEGVLIIRRINTEQLKSKLRDLKDREPSDLMELIMGGPRSVRQRINEMLAEEEPHVVFGIGGWDTFHIHEYDPEAPVED